MILKQLNGELIDFPEIPYPPVLYDHYTYLKKVVNEYGLRRKVADALGGGIRQRCIRFVHRPRDEKGAENPGFDAYLIVTEYPFVDLSNVKPPSLWRSGLETCPNQGVRDFVRKFRSSHTPYSGSILSPPSSGGGGGREFDNFDEDFGFFTRPAYDNVDSPDDGNVARMLSAPHQFAYIPGFCKNPHDRIVDWLLANRHFITYPDFLGNSNDRAVEMNIAWLEEHYAELKPRFDENPELSGIYEKYLTANTNVRMFWYVMEKCDYHKPRNDDELLHYVARMPFPIDVVWEWNRSNGWV